MIGSQMNYLPYEWMIEKCNQILPAREPPIERYVVLEHFTFCCNSVLIPLLYFSFQSSDCINIYYHVLSLAP